MSNRKILTKADVAGLSPGSVIVVGPEDIVTSGAREEALRLGVRLEEHDATTSREPAREAVAAADPGKAAWHDAGAERDGRVMVTVVGRNRPGVMAELTARIAELKCDILDVNQKVVEGFFYVIFLLDIRNVGTDFRTFKQSLESAARPGDYQVTVQHEKIFRYMHRI